MSVKPKPNTANFIPPSLFENILYISTEVTKKLREDHTIHEDEEISPRAIAYDIIREAFQPVKCSHLKMKDYTKSKTLRYCTGCYGLFRYGAVIPLRLIEYVESLRINENIKKSLEAMVRDGQVNREIELTKAEQEEMVKRSRELETMKHETIRQVENKKRLAQIERDYTESKSQEGGSYTNK